jgi:hypothetical protein
MIDDFQKRGEAFEETFVLNVFHMYIEISRRIFGAEIS